MLSPDRYEHWQKLVRERELLKNELQRLLEAAHELVRERDRARELLESARAQAEYQRCRAEAAEEKSATPKPFRPASEFDSLADWRVSRD